MKTMNTKQICKTTLVLALSLPLVTVCGEASAQTFSPMETGMNSHVMSITGYKGAVYAGGVFTTADGKTSNAIAKWDGTKWSPLGSGMSNIGMGGEYVAAMAEYNGVLYAMGNFIMTDGLETSSIAKWYGSNWTPIANGQGVGLNAPANAATVFNNKLYIGGSFFTVNSAEMYGVSETDGTTWSALKKGVDNAGSRWVYALCEYNGELYVAGKFNTASGLAVSNIAKWNGTSWSDVGGGTNDFVQALAVYNGELYVGGLFTQAGGITANRIAKWNGSKWSAVGTGTDDGVYALKTHNGKLYAGGSFLNAGGVTANRLATWNGTTWEAVGTGMNGGVWALYEYNGALYIGGGFTTANGTPANFIAMEKGATLPTDVNEITTETKEIINFNIYPVPAQEQIQIQLNASRKTEATIIVFNVLGAKAIETKTTLVKGNNNLQIDICSLNNGYYILEILTEYGTIQKKFIK